MFEQVSVQLPAPAQHTSNSCFRHATARLGVPALRLVHRAGPCLRVGQIVALVVVQRQAQAALVLAQVIAHKVRVFREVDRLQRQPPQTLSPVDGLRRTLTTRYIRSQLTSSIPAQSWAVDASSRSQSNLPGYQAVGGEGGGM